VWWSSSPDNRSLLELAWLACDNADLDQFHKVRKQTREVYRRQFSFVWLGFKDLKECEANERSTQASMKVAKALGGYSDKEDLKANRQSVHEE
jgi:hypothetical protein